MKSFLSLKRDVIACHKASKKLVSATFCCAGKALGTQKFAVSLNLSVCAHQNNLSCVATPC